MYATQQDLYERFGDAEMSALADRDGDGLPDNSTIDQALADASAEMDGYFRAAGYDVPLASIPSVTSRICCNLARYNLYSDTVPERVQKLHDDAVAWLKAVSAGTVSIGVADDGSEPAARNNVVEIQSGGNVFSRDGCGDY